MSTWTIKRNDGTEVQVTRADDGTLTFADINGGAADVVTIEPEILDHFKFVMRLVLK